MASSYSTEADNIVSFVDDNFSIAPVQYPNQGGFTPPSDSEWVRMTINDGEAFAADIANDQRFRHTGTVVFQCFTPASKGDKDVREIVDELVGLFRFADINEIGFDVPNVSVVGLIGDPSKWYQITISVPFDRDTVTFDN